MFFYFSPCEEQAEDSAMGRRGNPLELCGYEVIAMSFSQIINHN